MLYYPPVSQYPIARRTSMRTVVNALADGGTVRAGDSAAQRVRWELRYSGLTVAEWQAIEELFVATQGQVGLFTFLDPAENLLAWSEDFSNGVWRVDPMLQVTAGASDPRGGTGAVSLTNTGQAAQRVSQVVAGASWFEYCFSVWVRSDAGTVVSLVFAGSVEEARLSFAAGTAWVRVVKSGALVTHEDGIRFAVELPAGGSVRIFGPQVEAQVAAGGYKKTTDRAGVYGKARFEEDRLRGVAESVGRFGGVVRVVSGL
jgi:hypothetical protein